MLYIIEYNEVQDLRREALNEWCHARNRTHSVRLRRLDSW
jgi:hypothetical protein